MFWVAIALEVLHHTPQATLGLLRCNFTSARPSAPQYPVTALVIQIAVRVAAARAAAEGVRCDNGIAIALRRCRE